MIVLAFVLPDRIKVAANTRDMPYQSFIKAWLSEKVSEKL